jgi:hypothetical protein
VFDQGDFSPSRFPRQAAHRALARGASPGSSTTSSPRTPSESSGTIRPRPPGDSESSGTMCPRPPGERHPHSSGLVALTRGSTCSQGSLESRPKYNPHLSRLSHECESAFGCVEALYSSLVVIGSLHVLTVYVSVC